MNHTKSNSSFVLPNCSFFTSKWYFITQNRSGLGILVGTEQPIKCRIWSNVQAILAKPYVVWFCTLSIWKILKSKNSLWSNATSPSSVEKLGHALGSLSVNTISLQSVPKCWQSVCCSIDSISHINAFRSECKEDIRLSLFLNPKSCSNPYPSIYTQPNPLYCASAVHLPDTYSAYLLRLEDPHGLYQQPKPMCGDSKCSQWYPCSLHRLRIYLLYVYLSFL